MTRQRPSLRRPQPHENVRGFPVFRIDERTTLWRLVRKGHGPWWYGSSLDGRFDLAPPHGTCYVANDDLGAILETLGPDLLPGGLAPARLLRDRQLRAVRVPHAHRLANCLAQKAAKWITAEVGTLTPYEIPQAWAKAFHRGGFEGVRYGSRHLTSRRPYSVALFGSAGERSAWPKGRAVPLASDHRERLRRRCGVTLFDIPFEDELLFAKGPVAG